MTQRSFPAPQRTLWLLFPFLLAGACNAFEKDMYEEPQTGGAGGASGSAGSGGGTAGDGGGAAGSGGGTAGSGGGAGATNWSAVSDTCPLPGEKILNSNVLNHTGTYKLNDLADNIQNCHKLAAFNGPDGVIGLDLAGGQRVSVDAEFVVPAGQSAPEVDLGICVMGACDPATGSARVDRCPAGVGENILWSTANAGTFFVNIDSKAYDTTKLAPELRLTVSYPTCGNKLLDKGETCDDGNKVNGDGCTDECLKELKDTGLPPMEAEPNNHYIAGNLILVDPGKTVLVKGSIGGGCDLDFFLLDVPAGSFPRVTMLMSDGKDCPTGTPAFPLEFNDPTGAVKLGAAPNACQADAGTAGQNCCPKFDENTFAGVKSLPKGRYTIELKPFNKGVGNPAFNYALKVEMLAAGDGG